MWQGTGSTNKWNLSCYSPRVQAVFFCLRRFVREGGGSTAAAVTLNPVAVESRKKMADGVARSPSRLCSRDGKICCYGYAVSTIFLLAFVPCFLLFIFFFFLFFFFSCIPVCLSSSRPFVCAQPSTTLSKYVFHSTCSFCLCHLPYPISDFFCFFLFVKYLFFFRSSYFSGGVFFVVLSYPVR